MTTLFIGDLAAVDGKLERLVSTSGDRFLRAATPEAAIGFAAEPIDCICGMPARSGWSGRHLLRIVSEHLRGIPVVIYQPQGAVTSSAHLMAAGAFHCVFDALPAERLLEILAAAAATRIAPSSAPASEPWRNLLIGESRSMETVRDIISMVGRTKSTVLITGETGTGKELAARALHMVSDRSQREMVNVNCAALPDHLLEAELFGHTRGAFTGAVGNRTGRFEQAHLSTIFLDEIGDMPLETQAKLLRVLQERELQRIGSSETIRVDVRVVAASNINLHEAVSEKKFRQDLLYRLRVVELRMPSLRERLSDIPVLVNHFIEKVCRREKLPAKRMEQAALDCLAAHAWPGNVRELEHAIESAAILSGTRSVLTPSDLQLIPAAGATGGMDLELPDAGINLERFVGNLEAALLSQALQRAGGNKARAADMLQMPRTTLISKVKALRLVS